MRKVVRILEYIGQTDWVDITLKKGLPLPFNCGRGRIKELLRIEGRVEEEDEPATECDHCGKVLIVGVDKFRAYLKETPDGRVQPMAMCKECQNENENK